MKKTRKSRKLETKRLKNPVAKFAHQFNKAQVFKDRTKYQRQTKHKGKEPFLMMLKNTIRKGFILLGSLCQRNYFLTKERARNNFAN